MFQFGIAPKIQVIDTCREFCESFGVTDSDLFITNGLIADRYLNGLTGNAVIVDTMKYGTGEPNDGMVEAILADLAGVEYTRVIAIGGGSVLDIAKLFALSGIYPVQDLFERKLPIVKSKELILVPTTCGTGSEVTNISILELLKKKTKMGLAVDELYGDYAVLVPELLDSLPYPSFATSSLDAFIHAIESYLSPKASVFTQMYSCKAMEMILSGYKMIASSGIDARLLYMKEFLIASTYAGIAFGNAGCAAVHALSYPLGAVFHIAHGESNYAMFEGVFRKYMELDPCGRIVELNQFLASILECKEDQVYEVLGELFASILPRKPLSSYGVTEENLKEFTDSVMVNQGRLMANNYVTLSADEVYKIYQSVY